MTFALAAALASTFALGAEPPPPAPASEDAPTAEAPRAPLPDYAKMTDLELSVERERLVRSRASVGPGVALISVGAASIVGGALSLLVGAANAAAQPPPASGPTWVAPTLVGAGLSLGGIATIILGRRSWGMAQAQNQQVRARLDPLDAEVEARANRESAPPQPPPAPPAPTAPRVVVESPSAATPQMGALVVRVVESRTRRPLAGAQVQVGAASAIAGPDGTARFARVASGPQRVSVRQPGFRPADEAVAVSAASVFTLDVAMASLSEAVLAEIKGIVRDAGNKPVVADISLPELNLRTRCDSTGAFSFRVNPGQFRMAISAGGYRQQVKEVQVIEGAQAIFNIVLERESPSAAP